MSQAAHILVVEDERSMREFVEILLERNGYQVTVAPDGAAGCTLLREHEYDLVLSDLRMPEVDGIEVLRCSKATSPHTEVVMMTAFATAETAIAAMKEGAYDYLTKPFKVDEVTAVVQRALEKRALVRDNQALRQELAGRYRLQDLVGRSRAMQRVFELIRKVAATKTIVLITGESGTGKELVARAIHDLGARAEKPFVPVNCGAIPESLIESELFGHVKGAFTSANQDKTGLFAAAEGGTLFLDEIAELPVAMQVKLLRTLQERRIKPVGANTEQPVDVRIVAATNRNLDEEVAEGRFRQDLFYRLNVIPLPVPALRERREDIPLLLDHFIRKYAAEQGRAIAGLTPEAMAQLCSYHYPGNVRELENLTERAVTLTSSDLIDASALPELSRKRPGAPLGELPEGGLDLDAHIGRIEQQLVTQALSRVGGKRADAARILGISLRSLRYRLAKFGIDEPAEDAS